MARLRSPLLLVALLLAVGAVLVDLGNLLLSEPEAVTGGQLARLIADADLPEDAEIDAGDLREMRGDAPPGLGVPDLVYLDLLLVFTLGLMTLALVIPERFSGRIQGIATVVVSLLVLLAAFAAALKAFGQIVLMLALFLSPPFGTLAYLARYGFFDRGGAAVALSLRMLLLLGAALCLVLAHQRFLQNKGLVLLAATGLGAGLLTTFLHRLPPSVLVSITDAVAGLVNAVLAILWAVFLLVFGIVAVVKALRLDRSA